MADNRILGSSPFPILCLWVIFSCFFGSCCSLDELGLYNTFTISSFRYPETKLKPFDSRYIRVDLPPWFSWMSITVESDVDLDASSTIGVPKSSLPIICFRNGSPPLPDISRNSLKGLGSLSNVSFEGIHGLDTMECYPMQKTISLNLANDQISPGVWYLGLFNGIGPTRTQSKMINRGKAYSFSANISVQGCATSTTWGQYCNRTVEPLSCFLSDSYDLTESLSDGNTYNQKCGNSYEIMCHRESEPKVYFFEVVGISEQLNIMAMNVTGSSDKINLMCFARLGAMASATKHDYSGDISKAPLIIHSPKVGRWYLTIIPANLSKEPGGNDNTSLGICYSMLWQVVECPVGKAGSNCTWDRYTLQTVLRRDSTPFESYYLPVSEKVSFDSANFPVEPLSSNSSYSGESNNTWTYFILNVPRGAAGVNIHVQIISDAKINYEIYTRFGGLPSPDSWDYYYANGTRSSDGSIFFLNDNSSESKFNFYILDVREGTWGFGLRHLNTSDITANDQTTMSISLERCPKRCSSHGQCRLAYEASGLTSYSYCACDRNHGGFDCSVEIVSHKGHLWQSISLIASNAAAVLPAFWALRQKAFAEWVLFTSSGISSGLYHACDVGTWCALPFSVLQFMDFWLSFMAVVSTFIYLTTIDEAMKRTMHTVVAILTALMAITKATRSSNIILVIAIGALGLLIGLLMELSTKYRSFSTSVGFCLNILDRWQTIKRWLHNLLKTLLRRFRWGFIIAGFTTLAMAAISWTLESSESYWIWHSLWHVTIYTSSFFFLCSKAIVVEGENERRSDGNYALTRQDSFSRGV
ncbi:uncharacterized protein LOC120003999 [Tripterygium wilfordii]|uniref:uncharacterized protein LOC120003999 n=1 Tax=Tripterygium wilfordii TaxID=458696 RepID=UPI0018F82C4E|nr:uncharacterized protein LOC120003999 [Tripterygium wilfordii]